MSRLRLAYYASLVLLVALLALVLRGALLPATSPASEAQRAQLVELPDHWVLRHDITNQTPETVHYIIEIAINKETPQRSEAIVKSGGRFNYLCHVYPEQLGSGQVTLSVYEKGREDPVDTTNYFLMATGLAGPSKGVPGPNRG